MQNPTRGPLASRSHYHHLSMAHNQTNRFEIELPQQMFRETHFVYILVVLSSIFGQAYSCQLLPACLEPHRLCIALASPVFRISGRYWTQAQFGSSRDASFYSTLQAQFTCRRQIPRLGSTARGKRLNLSGPQLSDHR